MNILDQIYFQNPWFRDHGHRPGEALLPRRKLYKAFLDHVVNTKQVTSLTGIRRVGKSTLMKQTIGALLDSGVSPERILYFSFDQPTILREMDTLESVIMTYLERVTHVSVHDANEKHYLFFDEVQLVPYWQDILKRFYDQNQLLKFVISGSASLFLLTKSKESLAGRIFEFSLSPLAFSEYQVLSKKSDMGEYLDFGQFPELIELDRVERKKEYLKEIIAKVIEVDVMNLYGIRNISDFARLFWSLLPNTGQVVVSAKLMSDLRIKKATLFHYLTILEGSLLIHKVLNLSGSFRSESRLLRKLYPGSSNFLTLGIDPVAVGFKSETYASSLLASKNKVHFYHERGKEIDFVLPEKKLAIEVKYQEHIRSADYQYLFDYAKKKHYQSLLVTKSYNAQATHIAPRCVSLDMLENYLDE